MFEKKSYSVVLLGNSITYDFDKHLNNHYKVSGIRQFTTSQLTSILDQYVFKYDPDTCFIEGGINDIFQGIPLERTAKNYDFIVNALLHKKITPVLQSTLYVTDPYDYQTFNRDVDSLNVYLKKLAYSKGIKYLDINSLLSKDGRLSSEYTVDGVHLNGSAYKIWKSLL
jgi:alpha-glucosidase